MLSPFFIVGASRSGTTMLRLILNAHSRLAVSNEFGYFGALPAGTDIDGWRNPKLSEAQYRQFVQDFLQRRAHIFKQIGIEHLEKQILSSEVRDLREPYRIAAEAWAQHHGKVRWGEKTPGNLYYVDVLADMFPEARFIYLVRDPRAVVCSMNNIEYFSNDTVLNALNWHQAVSSGYRLLVESVPISQRLTLKYENLVQDTENQIRTLCDFIGESFEPGMLNFYRDAEKYMGHVIRTPSIGRPVNKRSLDKWKHQLSASEIGVIESLCAEGMARFGYERTSLSPSLPDQMGKLIRLVYWKLQHWRHRKKRGYMISHQMLGRTRKRLSRLFGAHSGGRLCLILRNRKECELPGG